MRTAAAVENTPVYPVTHCHDYQWDLPLRLGVASMGLRRLQVIFARGGRVTLRTATRRCQPSDCRVLTRPRPGFVEWRAAELYPFPSYE